MSGETPTDNARRPVCGMLLHAYYVRDPRVQREAHALRDAGWRVKVICLNEGTEAAREEVDGVEVIRCRMGRSRVRSKLNYVFEYLNFMLRSFFRLVAEDFRERHDAVVVHNMPNALVFSALGVRLRGCPVILDLHDAAPEVFASLFGMTSPFWRRVLLFEERMAVSFASAHITANAGMKKVFIERNRNADFLLVHNSPAQEHMPKMPVPTYDGGVFRIAFHGHIHERYGLQRLIGVLPKLAERGIDVTLDVFGDGPYGERAVGVAEEFGVADKVTFHGRFTLEELARGLSRMHLGVALHFKDDLGDLLLPVKILECTQGGLPVLSSDLATVQAYFDEAAMWFFSSDEELLEQVVTIVKNYDVARAKVPKAREAAESIAWQREACAYVDYVERLCSRA